MNLVLNACRLVPPAALFWWSNVVTVPIGPGLSLEAQSSGPNKPFYAFHVGVESRAEGTFA